MNNISFPNIGLSMNIDPVAFHVGSHPVYWYAIIILSGFITAMLFVCATCEDRSVKKDNIWDIAL